jgi:hypothetical protein
MSRDSSFNPGFFDDSDFPHISFQQNWRSPETSGRTFVVHGLGRRFNDVTRAIVEAFKEEEALVDYRVAGFDAAVASVDGGTSAPMLISEEFPGHQIASTLYIKRTGEDLFFTVSVAAYSRLKWLHLWVRSILAVLFFLLIYGVFFSVTDQKAALFWEFARKYSPSDPGLKVEAMLSGFAIDQSSGQVGVGHARWTIWDILRSDPKLFLTHMAGPPALILAAIGFISSMIPNTVFDFASRSLGWPTASEFSRMMKAELAGTDSIVNRVLDLEFGVSKADISQV